MQAECNTQPAVGQAPGYHLHQLLRTYHLRELCGWLRVAERELFAAREDPDASTSELAFWEDMVSLYQRAVDVQRARDVKVDAARAMHAGSRIDYAALKRSIDIVEYISRYTDLRQQGRSFLGRCPFHDDRGRPNLVVWPEPPVFRCFSCGAKGDVITFRRLIGDRQ